MHSFNLEGEFVLTGKTNLRIRPAVPTNKKATGIASRGWIEHERIFDFSSEKIFQAKLNLTLRSSGATDLAKAGSCCTLSANGRVGIAEIDIVERVKQLRTELQSRLFRH